MVAEKPTVESAHDFGNSALVTCLPQCLFHLKKQNRPELSYCAIRRARSVPGYSGITDLATSGTDRAAASKRIALSLPAGGDWLVSALAGAPICPSRRVPGVY